MKQWSLVPLVACLLGAAAQAAACTMTDYGLTAALVNPGVVSGTLDATGCDIAVYFNLGKGLVKNAIIFGAKRYGVLVNGDKNGVAVDVLDNLIHDIVSVSSTGTLRGVGVYYRAFQTGTARGKIAGNKIFNCVQTGIIASGLGTKVDVSGNTVTGLGPTGLIAQYGIQIGHGASALVMRNSVSEHRYTGETTVAGGILVLGGPYYGTPYTEGTQIVGNTLVNNDIGVWLSNKATRILPPLIATNIKVVNNVITNDGLQNHWTGNPPWVGYQAGVLDIGNNDKIIANTTSGAGYDPAANPGAFTVEIDADPTATNRPKVHANE